MRTLKVDTQTCIGPCKRQLAITNGNFYRQSNYKTGFTTKCKRCVVEVNAINFQKRQTVQKAIEAERIRSLRVGPSYTAFDKVCLYRRYQEVQQGVISLNLCLV